MATMAAWRSRAALVGADRRRLVGQLFLPLLELAPVFLLERLALRLLVARRAGALLVLLEAAQVGRMDSARSSAGAFSNAVTQGAVGIGAGEVRP